MNEIKPDDVYDAAEESHRILQMLQAFLDSVGSKPSISATAATAYVTLMFYHNGISKDVFLHAMATTWDKLEKNEKAD